MALHALPMAGTTSFWLRPGRRAGPILTIVISTTWTASIFCLTFCTPASASRSPSCCRLVLPEWVPHFSRSLREVGLSLFSYLAPAPKIPPPHSLRHLRLLRHLIR